MNVVLNGKAHQMESGQTVWDALVLIGASEDKGVAVAMGVEVVPRSEWQNTLLVEGQRLEILRAVQGGSN